MAESTDGTPDSGANKGLERLLSGMTNSRVLRNAEQLEALSTDLMKAVAEHARMHPSPDVAMEDELEQRARMGQWEEVMRLRNQLIERCRTRGEAHQVWRHEREMAALLQHLHRPSDARLHARRAVAAAREVDGIPVMVGIALQLEAVCAMHCGELREALKVFEDSLSAIGSEECARHIRGGALVCRALCLLSLDDIAAAEADLEAAGECLGIHSECPDLAGIQSRRAGWCEAQARRCGKRGDKSMAVQWMIRAIDLRQRTASQSREGSFHALAGLAGCYHKLAAICDGLGDTSDAATARQRRDQLLAQLKLPAIPDKC